MQRSIVFLILSLVISISLSAQTKNDSPQNKNDRIALPNGWSLSPAGHGFLLGDLPLNMAVSSSNKFIAITNNGWSRQCVQLLDVSSEKIVDEITIPRCWFGLKFSQSGKFLYVSGGNDNWILKYSIIHSKLLIQDTFKLGKKWPEKISPTGIDIDDKANLLYVVTKESNSLYIIDLISKKIIDKYQLGGPAYTCLLSPNKEKLYISCWGCDELIVFNTVTRIIERQIRVGDNPNDICMTKDGKYIFVANSNDNSVSIISAESEKVVETLTSSLYPNAPQGSTTNGLALSSDEKTLYIANADNNCLTVFDISQKGKSIPKGFIPTGWYPTCVKVVGDKIFVTNGKGFSSFANPLGPNPIAKHNPNHNQYIAGLFIGAMSVINVPDKKKLGIYSKEVYINTPYTKKKETLAEGKEGSPIPVSIKGSSPIKHVFYIIKENRTYDQVLGDVKGGNGDTSLVLFGRRITPNQHKLAKDFVLLDNFYVDAEVSIDGHNWSMGAYATDYLEKSWPSRYSGRGGTSSANGVLPVANNKNGYLWANCQREGVSYRTYGEFVDDHKPHLASLMNNYCHYSTGWNLEVRDTTRYNQWKRDFDSLLRLNAIPQLNTIRFPSDHTQGMSVGKYTPFSYVADNDLAVGMFVDYLSKSPIWKSSVIIIVEDDAQSGPDHVDAHRSTAYIIGPYVKRHFIDHTHYTTSSILRTIELILRLPPMSQYDAAATSLWRCFTRVPNYSFFNYLPSNINLNDKNTVVNELSKKSETFDFSKEDIIPDAEFNEVIWKGVKGIDSPVPSPTRAAFIIPIKNREDN